MTPTPGDALAAEATRFLALRATGNVSFVGIDAFTASLTNLDLQINQGSGGLGKAANLSSGLHVQTGDTTEVVLDSPGTIFQASGTIALTIGSFVGVFGGVAFERGTTVTETLVAARRRSEMTALKVGASHVDVFVGVNGPRATNPARSGSRSRTPISRSRS